MHEEGILSLDSVQLTYSLIVSKCKYIKQMTMLLFPMIVISDIMCKILFVIKLFLSADNYHINKLLYYILFVTVDNANAFDSPKLKHSSEFLLEIEG